MSDKKSAMSVYLILSVVLITIVFILWTFYGSRDWQKTEGEINHIKITEIHNDTISPMSTNKSFTEFKIDLEYSYSYHGNTYTGKQLYPLIPNVFSDREYAEELVEKYRPGKKTDIYIDPNNPQNSCLITSKNISSMKYIIMTLVFFIIATILIIGIKYFNHLFDD